MSRIHIIGGGGYIKMKENRIIILKNIIDFI